MTSQMIVILSLGINLNILFYLLGFDNKSLYMTKKNKIIFSILCLIPFLYSIMVLIAGLYISLRKEENNV